MADPTVEDLWAGLDSFETELQGIQDAEAPQASTLDKIDDLLELVKKQEQSWEALPEAPIVKPLELPKSSLLGLSVLGSGPTNAGTGASLKAAASPRGPITASPRRATPREEAEMMSTHERRVDLVRKLCVSARGDSITQTQRSAIDRLLSLAKPDSDDLDDLVALDADMKRRAEMNVGAPQLLVEQQARLDADNVMVLERKLATKLAPRRSSTATSPSSVPRHHEGEVEPTSTAAIPADSDDSECSSSTNGQALSSSASVRVTLSDMDLKEFEELEQEAQRVKVDVSDKNEFMEALSELEKRSAYIQSIALGQVPLSEIGSVLSPRSVISPRSTSSTTLRASSSETRPAGDAEKAANEAEELARMKKEQDRERRLQELAEESARKEKEHLERVELAKQQALEKARMEFQQQLEEAKRAQEAELASIRQAALEEQARRDAQQKADREAHEAQLDAMQRRMSTAVDASALALEEVRREAQEEARKELESERARVAAEAATEIQAAQKMREELEAKISAEREAQRQSELIVEEAFRAKLMAESRAAQESAARSELELKLTNDEREKESLIAKLKAGEQAQRLLQARIEMEAQQLHAEYLAKIKDVEISEKARADAEAMEKAKLKEQLIQIKTDAEARTRENELAMAESRAQLERLSKQNEDTERQLLESRAKAQALEDAKDRAVKVYASIEAEHDHISGQFEASLREAEQASSDHRAKLHQVVETQKGAAHAALASATTGGVVDQSKQQQILSSLADAKRMEDLEKAEVERQALLAAEREAVSAEKNRALETRLRLERASEQMRAKLQMDVQTSASGSPGSDNHDEPTSSSTDSSSPSSAGADRANASDLNNAEAPTIRLPSTVVHTEKKSAHIFHSTPKESIRPSEDILSFYQPVPASSPSEVTAAGLQSKSAALLGSAASSPTSTATPKAVSSPSLASAAPSSNSATTASVATPASPAPVSTFTRTVTSRKMSPIGSAKIGMRRDSSEAVPQLRNEASSGTSTSNSAASPPRSDAPSSASVADVSPSSSPTSSAKHSYTHGHIQVTTVKTPATEAEPATASATTNPEPAPIVAAAVAAAPITTATSSISTLEDVDALLGSVKLSLSAPKRSPSSTKIPVQPRTLSNLDDLLNEAASTSTPTLAAAPSSSVVVDQVAMESMLADVDAILGGLGAGDGPGGSTTVGSEAPSGEQQLSAGGVGECHSTSSTTSLPLNGGISTQPSGPASHGRSSSSTSRGLSSGSSSSPSSRGGSLGGGGGPQSATAGSRPGLFQHTPLTNKQTLEIIVPSLKNRTFTCVIDHTQTIASLKLFVWVEVFGLQRVSIQGTHMDYVFRAEEDDYFSDEKMRFCDTPYFIECTKEDIILGASSAGAPHTVISLFLVAKQEIAKVNEQIESMIGYRLCQSEEALAFRKEMHHVVNRVMQISYRRIRVPQLNPFENVDGYLPAQFNVHVWFWHETSIESHQQTIVTAKLHDSANVIIQRILDDHPYQFKDNSEIASDYVLKVRGLDDWVWDVIELISLENVRNCLRKRRKVELVVYSRDATPSHITEVLSRYDKEFGLMRISSKDRKSVSVTSSSSRANGSQSVSQTSNPSSSLRASVRAGTRSGLPVDIIRSSVAIGFDLTTVFKSEDHVPSSWYKSWDLTDRPLTVKIRSVDHIPFDSALFKLPKKRDALTHIFVAATIVTPVCIPSGSIVPYTCVGPTARTLPELYMEDSLEPITLRADLFLPPYSLIPRASKLRLEVVVRYKETETVVAWHEQPVFTFDSIVRTGVFAVNCSLGNSSTCGSSWSIGSSSHTSSSIPINAPGMSTGTSPSFNSGTGSASNMNMSGMNAGGSSLSGASSSNINISSSSLNVNSDFANASDASASDAGSSSPQLLFEVEALDQPVVYPSKFSCYENHPSLANLDPSESNPSTANLATMNGALNTLLHRPTRQEQAMFWKHRPWCQKNAKSLDLVLASVPWSKSGALQHSYLMLDRWQSPTQPLDAIQILNKNHLEPRFREHAVRILHRLSDSELAEVLLQLVQSLKHEISHDSPLARFLLVRALFNQNQIGHYFYWHLKACMQMPVYRDRFSLVLEVYLRYCSSFRQELWTQTLIYNRLIAVASELKTIKDPPKRIPFLHEKLNQMANQGLPNPLGSGPNIPMPSTFQLPIGCNLLGRNFNVTKCKNLESKTLPLWLVAESADPLGEPVYGIMKVGDDLRQDQLTLQMFGIMDKLWLANGLDLKMSAYRVIETGMECGMIEVVPNAQTNAQIQMQYGGVTAAFSDKPLSDWLQKNNPNEHDMAAAVKDFASSCAGYCVATYVLGIGDRHNDNIMITKSGHLFHIDFGRFLGNSEKFAGVSRDRAPFVFTPEFAYVMGGQGSPTYQRFVQLCCTAYNIVRRHASLFTSLLAMMLQTGIPELRSEDDIRYLTDAFSLELTEEEAAKKFESLISKSLETTATQLNFAIHIWANQQK